LSVQNSQFQLTTLKIKQLNKMKLFTKAIEAEAQAQFPLGNNLEKQVVVAKFFNPTGLGTWWLMNQDPNDPDYCWGICHIFEWEVGSFSKSELENYRGRFGLGIERDLHFEEVNAKKLLERLYTSCTIAHHMVGTAKCNRAFTMPWWRLEPCEA
jgi:hypothetical protein